MKRHPLVVVVGALMIAVSAACILITALVGVYFWQRYPDHDFDPNYAVALWWMPLVSAAALSGVGADMVRGRRVRPLHYVVVVSLCVLVTAMTGPLGVVFGVGMTAGLWQASIHDA